MPKVTKEYVEEKKKEIVDAAIRVCNSKPAYSVTMRDVLKEAGISIGRMYHYFSSIDEVFAEIINRTYGEMNFTADVDNIFESGKQPNEIIMDSLMLLGELMDEVISRFGKLLFYLDVIYINNPEIAKEMWGRFAVNEDANILVVKLITFIETQIANGYFKTNLPREYLSFQLLTSIEGIRRIAIARHFNQEVSTELGALKSDWANVKGMMKTSAEIIIRLLNS